MCGAVFVHTINLHIYGMDIKHTYVHYVCKQLAASQQGAPGGRKLTHTERTLTMVVLVDGVQSSPFSISPSRNTFKKPFWVTVCRLRG